MHGLVSLLAEPYYQQVEKLWDQLAAKHKLAGIRVTPYPHFSWQIANHYDFEALKDAMEKIASQTAPFQAQTAGLALFTGARPVIYIPVVKDATLLQLHQKIWQAAGNVGRDISPYYSPESWMPHISLAYEDVSRENIGAIMEDLAFRQFSWKMMVDNIALICEPSGEIGKLDFQIPFSG